ncbi:MAG: endoglucanase [Clostridium sp.]|nr:endoglucanase [Clostridium sp.]
MVKKLVCITLTLAMLLTALVVPQGFVSAAGTYNYAEALQKAIYFYECQQAGPLPEWNRVEWRGDATMNDEVLGGWYDAGDHVKFNLPMAYSAAMLGWALYEYGDGIKASGQKEYLERNLAFALDYLVACDRGDSVVYQIGDGGADHKWWGSAEVIEKEMERPYFTCSASCVTGQMAAALAVGSIVLKNSTYLQYAKKYFNIADTKRSDAGYTAANGFYSSHSGFWDELLWAATWLYLATGDQQYLDKAESYIPKLNRQNQTTDIEYQWAHCWDDCHYGAIILLARITGKEEYHKFAQMHLDWWTPQGYNGKRVNYTPGGLAHLDTWGPLRYAMNQAFLALVYSDSITDTALKQKYYNFAKSQIDYALGSNPLKRSYVVGFGNNPPERPHHRTAHGTWLDKRDIPDKHRHVLYGALVGGPARDDSYKDDIEDYILNEVATDYNAGFVGVLCRMTAEYGGTPLANFPPPEERDDEFFVEACINQNSSTYTEIKALLNNRSSWPARLIKDLSYRYYMDLTEVFEAGASVDDIKVRIGYCEAGMDATISPLTHLTGNIYYITISYEDGTAICPIGQEQYAAELQFRIYAPDGTNYWDPTNDFSYQGLTKDLQKTKYMPVYDGATRIFGEVPAGSVDPTPTKTNPTPSPTPSYNVLKGDINLDGAVDSLDLSLLKRFVLRKWPNRDVMYPEPYGKLSPEEFTNGDVNSDNVIDSLDVSLLKRFILRKIDKFPVGS